MAKRPTKFTFLIAGLLSVFAAQAQIDPEVLRKAEAGDASAQFNVGRDYTNGNGVTQNYAEAAKWYQRAADQGNREALNNLGIFYANGWGVPENKAKAFELILKSAEAGFDLAQCNIAYYYLEGIAVDKAPGRALYWYMKAADAGHAYAMYQVGECYYYGKGMDRDYTEAVYWYRKSAEKNNKNALYSLGYCYEKGQGLTADIALAKQYYTKAADLGSNNAKEALDKLSKPSPAASTTVASSSSSSTSTQRTPEQNFEYAKQQYAAGNRKECKNALIAAACYELPEAMVALANMMMEDAERQVQEAAYMAGMTGNPYGILMAQQMAQQMIFDAQHWYRQAAEKGNVEAQMKLQMMAAQGASYMNSQPSSYSSSYSSPSSSYSSQSNSSSTSAPQKCAACDGLGVYRAVKTRYLDQYEVRSHGNNTYTAACPYCDDPVMHHHKTCEMCYGTGTARR